MVNMFVANEAARLQTVQPYWQQLHPPLMQFDSFAELAARSLHTSYGCVSLINDQHMKLIGRCGLDATLLPRAPALGMGVLSKPAVHSLADARHDPVACQHPLVTGSLATRFYAAAPLYAPNGQVIGLVAVFDPQPRDLAVNDAALLQRLAVLISQALVWSYRDRFGAHELEPEPPTSPDVIEQSAKLSQQQISTELHISEERLRLAVESAALGTWDWDIASDRLVWSARLEALFGLTPGTFDGQLNTFLAYLHPDDRGATSEAIEQALHHHQSYDVEFRVIWPDQSVHWLSSKGKVFYADQGQPLRMLGICRDMTEHKQAEHAYARLADQMLAVAAENARLYLDAEEAIRARDNFLAIAAHELKTPITSLIGYTEMLQTLPLPSLSPRVLRMVQGVARQTTRLEHLIQGIIDLSDLQNGRFRLEPQAVDLHALAQQVVNELQPSLPHHTVHYHHPAAPVWIMGDRARLEQVLHYLLNNAIKFSPLGGLIAIDLSIKAPKQPSQHAQVELRVSDSGIGIPLNSQAHVFERYFRASNADPQHISGLGVGLYIIREVITRHYGHIEATSIEGQGTTFTIHLPLTLDQTASHIEHAVDHKSTLYEAA